GGGAYSVPAGFKVQVQWDRGYRITTPVPPFRAGWFALVVLRAGRANSGTDAVDRGSERVRGDGPALRPLFTDRAGLAAWRMVPSWALVSTLDRTINPDLLRFMARRAKARRIEVASGTAQRVIVVELEHVVLA